MKEDEFEKELLSQFDEEDKKGEQKKMSNLDKMHEWAQAQKENKESGGGGNSKFFKAKEGKNILRLIPGNYDGLPFVMYDQCYVGGKFYCVKDAGHNPFSIEGWKLHNEFKDSDPDAAKKARRKWLPTETVAVNVLVEGEVKIWVTSTNRMQEIIALSEDYPVFDLDKGHDIYLTRKGKGITTKYTLLPAPKATATKVNEDDITDLDDWLRDQWSSEKEMETAVRMNK